MSSPKMTNLNSGEHWAENPPLAQAFRDFDQANPHVYAELVSLCQLWIERRGQQKLGIGMLWEVLRWNLNLRTSTDEPFKLNNNHRSFYARKIMTHERTLADVFDLRKRDGACDCTQCVGGLFA